MFEQIINKCIESDSLICLNLNLNDLESVIIGKVVSFDSNTLIIDEINPYGTIIRNERKIPLTKIKLISLDDIYGTDLKYLTNNIELKNAKPKYLYFNRDGKDTLRVIIETSKNLVVSIFINNEFILGEIIHIEGKLVQINNITYQGFEDGYTYFDKSLITKIRYDGPLERKVTLLRNKKKELGLNQNSTL